MLGQFLSIGFIQLCGAMMPGPDFLIVTKNSVLYSQKNGIFTALGVGTATLVHMSYCLLGVGLLISHSLFLFNSIKYLGAGYLIYLGIDSLFAYSKTPKDVLELNKKHATIQAPVVSFQQGFFSSLLNPSATLFFLSLFTFVIKPDAIFWEKIVYAIEIASIAALWFCAWTLILSNQYAKHMFEKKRWLINLCITIALVGFGLDLSQKIL